jgi:hypothetical protein
MMEKGRPGVVFILHLVQDDFYLETDREFFSVGEHSTVRSAVKEHARDSGVAVDHADREGHEII